MILIKKKNVGFYTLEALVAVFIFMVGVVGVLQIQTTAIRANSDAQYRTNASYFAESIIGEMTVNKAGIPTFVSGSNPTYQTWLAELTKSMPGVSLNPPTITATATASTQTGTTYLVTVNIFWKKPGDSVASKYQTQTVIY